MTPLLLILGCFALGVATHWRSWWFFAAATLCFLLGLLALLTEDDG